MSRKINIYQTVENVMFKWPYDSYDAVVSLHGKDENGFIDCDVIYTEDDPIYDLTFHNIKFIYHTFLPT